VGGGLYEFLVVDPFGPSARISSTVARRISRKGFWIAAHIAFEVTLSRRWYGLGRSLSCG